MQDRTISNLQRRLEKWELKHLRQHAADLAERLERSEEELSREREVGDYWHEQATSLIQEMMEDGRQVGLTQNGEIIAGPPSDQLSPKEGEIYAGAITDKAGITTHFFLLPGDYKGPWKDALTWAKEIGGDLPNRVEQSLLYADVKAEFKEEAYWSNTEYASDPAFAWYQTFNYGYQDYDHKFSELRARAVRRLPI